MVVLYESVGSVYQGPARLLLKRGEDMNFVDINITTEGFEFIGKYIEVQGFVRDYRGYRVDIPWVKIREIKRTRDGTIFVIRIKTVDNISFNILSLDPQNISGFGTSNAKKNSQVLIEAINKAKIQIESHQPTKFCPNCGEKLKPESDYCGKCGHKIV